MSIEELEKAIELIEENGGGDFVGPRDFHLIKYAEEYLNVTFPPSYKRFLERYGCGDIEGIEIFGVINDDFVNSGIPDAIWLTMKHRDAGMSDNLVLFYSTGHGPYLALDASLPNSAGEYPVVSYDLNEDLKIVYEDFGEFLLKELETVLN